VGQSGEAARARLDGRHRGEAKFARRTNARSAAFQPLTSFAYRPVGVILEMTPRVTFEGEIIGVIGSGLFVRFDEVFEGYVPARRLEGDYFELNPHGTALVGRP
jgi:exoribonuclease R